MTLQKRTYKKEPTKTNVQNENTKMYLKKRTYKNEPTQLPSKVSATFEQQSFKFLQTFI